MAPAHTSEALTIADLLGGRRIFSIPAYQRDYAWTWQEADQLLTELLSEHKSFTETGQSNGSGYLGMIVVIDDSPPQRGASWRFRRGTRAPSEIIDGKQRLTTLTLLIAILRDLLRSKGDWLQAYLTETGRNRQWVKDTPRVLLEGHEQDFFARHVLPAGATQKRVPKALLQESGRRLREVRDHLSSVLQDRGEAFLEGFARTVLDRCEITAVIPPDIASGYRIFVTVNFRGKDLSLADIVKAELIGGLDPPARRKAGELWKSLQDQLEPPPKDQRKSRSAASLDNLLSYVHRMRNRTGGSIIPGIIGLAAAAKEPGAFIADTLAPLGNVMLTVKRAEHRDHALSSEINQVLTALNWLASNDWVPVAMSILHTHVRSPEKALQALKLLQRLAFALAIMSRGGDSREGRFAQAIEAVTSGADLDARGSPFVLSDEDDERVATTVASDPYRQKGNYCKPLLAWIAQVGGASNVPQALSGYSIEHILPRNATDTPYWQTRFPSPKVREAAVRSLGNLALVTDAQNRKVKTAEFPDKLAIYFRDGYVSPFDTTRMLRDIGDWNADAVLERERILFERVRIAWGLRTKVRSKLAVALKR